jgi:Protein of unknown function (DUF3489)
MTNAENRDTMPQQGTAAGNAGTKAVRAGKSTPAEAAPKRKRPPSRRAASRRTAGTKPRLKSAKTGSTAAAHKPRPESKGARILELISRAKGATMSELMQVTQWQAHSVRGLLSTAAKKQHLKITSTRNEAGQRVYQLDR